MKSKNELGKEELKDDKLPKKRVKNIILVLILFILIIAVIFAYYKRNSEQKKAEEFFGNDNCEALLHMSTMDLVEHTCKICGKKFQDSSMHADICKECAEKTDRCEFCGKKMSAEIKEKREQIMKNQEEN